MRLHLFFPPSPQSDISRQLQETLCTMLAKRIGVTLTGTGEDILHVFAPFDLQASRLMAKARCKRVPYIVSPLSATEPWNMPANPIERRRARRDMAKACMIHVCGEMERRRMETLGWNANLRVIPNTVVTNAITPNQMCEAMLRMYDEAMKQHDSTVRQEIADTVAANCDEDTTIRDICSQMLYMRYLHGRGKLGQDHVRHLTDTLLTADYDEDQFCRDIDSLGCTPFARRLLAVANKQCGLTEGFTPMAWADDKLASRMLRMMGSQTLTEQKTSSTNDKER